MASKKLIVIANGESKKTPIDALKTGEYDLKYTVTVLNKPDNSELIFVE